MDDQDVLHHLLNLEADADSLVNNAQAEADRRIAEGEKQSRARYDDVYSAEVKVLEENLLRSIAAVKDQYHSLLEEFRESLSARPVDMEAFSALAGKFLDAKDL